MEKLLIEAEETKAALSERRGALDDLETMTAFAEDISMFELVLIL